LPNEYLLLQVGRVTETDTLLAHNNSRNGAAAVYWALQVLPIGN